MRTIPVVKWVLPVLAAIGCLGAGVWLGMNLRPVSVMIADEEGLADEPQAVAGLVQLSDAKRQAVGLRVAPVEARLMHHVHTVPGRVHYDDTRHVEIKAATDGVLTRILVKPGDQVTAGQTLAILSSPEVGTARADVLQRLSELELARKSFEWTRQTSEHVAELIAAIESGRPMKELEEEFRERRLGEYRGTLLSAYSRYVLTNKLAERVTSAAESGAVSSRTVIERTSERESAEEILKAELEQSSFDTQRASESAQAQLQDCQRRYDIARQHLTTLLGYEDLGMDQPFTTTGLSLVEMRAPFAGTIEERVFGITERIRRGDRQFVLADTRQLWIAADLREADWQALMLQPGQGLAVESPALPGKQLEARLYYVGREVTPESNAIPLVATIDNSDGMLRPGLFVRVSVPLEVSSEVLAVPRGAVVEHERRRFVFVEELTGSYRRVDVRTGREEPGWIEIRSGLKLHDRVVIEGAFALKSELLLEREE